MKTDYDVIVIGGGAAGLTASGTAATLGAKTLLIERHRLGGDCTWTGCVPSKTLLHAAHVAHQMRTASAVGLIDTPPKIDFGNVMAHVRAVRQEVYDEADAPENLHAFNVETAEGEAAFVDPHTLTLTHNGQTRRLTARYVIVATGGRAAVPPIEGLGDTPHLTNETLFELDDQPERLAVIGGGPIGTEMAQAFQRLGTDVTVIDMADRILGNDNAELTAMLQDVLEGEGITYRFGASVNRVSQAEDGTIRVHIEQGGEKHTVAADALLVATGRRPNLDALNLDAAGVAYTKKGITVNDHCRTSVGHIYAVGDVTGEYQFTHMAEHMAKVAITNALTKVPMSMDRKRVPWVTYTAPELAHVGATEADLNERGEDFEVFRFPFTKVDRAVTESETTGLIKVFATRLTGKILGVSILGERAGEMICEYALAMKAGASLRIIADTIHPYPTYGLAVRRAADQWYIRNTRDWMIKGLQTVFHYRGDIPDLSDPDLVV